MKRHYTALWLLLGVAFVFFTLLSAREMPVVAGHQLKSSKIADNLLAKRAELFVDTVEVDTVEVDTVNIEEIMNLSFFPQPLDSAAHIILFIGDSMLEGLGPRMAAYAEHNGHTLYNVMWYSSTSESWGKSTRLKDYISKIKPSYIFVCLGANELFVKDIVGKREKYVKQIIADIDTIPFVWIGPPNWKEDTGINNLVASNAPEGSFFLSNGMSFDRAKDGAHPTRTSAAAWLDSVARWMPMNARHPILMEKPEKTTGKPKRLFVHQPSE